MFGSSDKTVSVKLRADVADYKKGMNDAGNSTRQFGRDAQTNVGKSRKEIEGVGKASGKAASAVKGFAAAGAAMISFEAVAGYLGDSISAASDLEQTMMKSKVIFGTHAAEIEKWGDTAATNFGLSKSSAIEAAAGFGDMFSQLGMTGDAAAKTSMDVVQLAGDLGSFNNLKTSEVLDMISGSLRGEYDSLQRVIPNINAARVENEALAATGKQAAKDLTAQEKATATLAIIQKDGARASGDFARSSGSLAIEQQKLNAQMEDLSAQIGETLLPIMTDLVEFGNSSFVPFLKDLAGAWSLVSDAGMQWNSNLFVMVASHQIMSGASEEAAKKAAELAAAQKKAADEAPGFGAGLGNVADKARGVGIDMQKVNDELSEFYQLALDARGATRDYEEALDTANESIKENGRTLNIGTEAGRRNQDALDGIAESAIGMAEANLTQGASVDSVRVKLEQQRTAFIQTATRMGMSKKAAGDLATQLGLTGGQAQLLSDKINGIPEQTTTKVNVGTSAAMTAIDAVKRALKGIQDESVQVTINRQVYNKPVFATGGPVVGPGTETSDSIPALLSNNEHVLTAAEVRAMGGHAAVERMRRLARTGALPRFATGGAVHLSPMRYAPTQTVQPAASSTQVTMNAYGLDADKAVQKAMREWQHTAVVRP